jgi:hypothetical protein
MLDAEVGLLATAIEIALKSRHLELTPQRRGRLTLAGVAILLLGFRWWYPEHLRLVFASAVAFYLLLYIAGVAGFLGKSNSAIMSHTF